MVLRDQQLCRVRLWPGHLVVHEGWVAQLPLLSSTPVDVDELHLHAANKRVQCIPRHHKWSHRPARRAHHIIVAVGSHSTPGIEYVAWRLPPLLLSAPLPPPLSPLHFEPRPRPTRKQVLSKPTDAKPHMCSSFSCWSSPSWSKATGTTARLGWTSLPHSQGTIITQGGQLQLRWGRRGAAAASFMRNNNWVGYWGIRIHMIKP